MFSVFAHEDIIPRCFLTQDDVFMGKDTFDEVSAKSVTLSIFVFMH